MKPSRDAMQLYLAECERRRRAYERHVKPDTGADDLIAEFKKSGKVNRSALVGEIAKAKLHHEVFGDDDDHDARIRFDLLDLLAEVIVGREKWQRAQAARKKEAARHEHERWQKLADAVWMKRPHLRTARVAKLIAEDAGASWERIRRVIGQKNMVTSSRQPKP